MPADKLVLISRYLNRNFRRLLKEKGKPHGAYRRFLDLRETDLNLPVRLFSGGARDGINKLEFVGVAALGLSQVEHITKSICDYLYIVRISRIDWAVDILGVSAWELATKCRVANVQNSRVYRSRPGNSFYPHHSFRKAILIYERLKRLRSERNPLAKVFRSDDLLTRCEVQFRGAGVPIRKFSEIRCYADIDMLERVSFLQFCRLPATSKPQQILAAERLHALVGEVGLQIASKRFSAAEWAQLNKKFFEPMSKEDIPDVRSLMKKSVVDWLEDRVRFPRCNSDLS